MSEETKPIEPQDGSDSIDLGNVGDRFKVVEYFLKLRDRELFESDRHPAALYVGALMGAFAEAQVADLMGVSQPSAEAPEEKIGPWERLTDEEIDVLKSLIAELRKPQQPIARTTPPAPVQADRPVRTQAPMTPHIPGKRGLAVPLPAVGTVRRGPLSRPTLSKDEMEATTAIQSKIAGERGFRNFRNLNSSTGVGRDHTEERE